MKVVGISQSLVINCLSDYIGSVLCSGGMSKGETCVPGARKQRTQGSLASFFGLNADSCIHLW